MELQSHEHTRHHRHIRSSAGLPGLIKLSEPWLDSFDWGGGGLTKGQRSPLLLKHVVQSLQRQHNNSKVNNYTLLDHILYCNRFVMVMMRATQVIKGADFCLTAAPWWTVVTPPVYWHSASLHHHTAVTHRPSSRPDSCATVPIPFSSMEEATSCLCGNKSC